VRGLGRARDGDGAIGDFVALIGGEALELVGIVVQGLNITWVVLAALEFRGKIARLTRQIVKRADDRLERLAVTILRDAVRYLELVDRKHKGDGRLDQIRGTLGGAGGEGAIAVAGVDVAMERTETKADMQQETRLVEERGMRVDGAGDMHRGDRGGRLRAARERGRGHTCQKGDDEAKDDEFAFHGCDSFSDNTMRTMDARPPNAH